MREAMTNRLVRTLCGSLLLAAFLIATATQGEEPVNGALSRLKSVEIFAIGPVGYAGITSQGERDYRAILVQPLDRSVQLFKELYATGNPQAKGYALAGIRKRDPVWFKQIYSQLGSSKEMVTVERDCIVSSEPFGTIAKEIDAGKFPYDK
jgi:hypothetical protein